MVVVFPEYVLALREFEELLAVAVLESVLLYLGESPLVFTLDLPLNALVVAPLFIVFLL